MQLDDAVTRLRELGDAATTDTAAWLVRQLEPEDDRKLNDPFRRCGEGCRIAAQKSKWDEQCPCIATTLALRLTELAFGERQVTPERMVMRHRITCPACRVPFVSKRKSARYCPTCEGVGSKAA